MSDNIIRLQIVASMYKFFLLFRKLYLHLDVTIQLQMYYFSFNIVIKKVITIVVISDIELFTIVYDWTNQIYFDV